MYDSPMRANPLTLLSGLLVLRVDARDEDGWTPLHWAAFFNSNPQVVLVLLDLGADPKARTSGGDTAWDLIQGNPELKNTPAYWKLNDLRF